MHLVGFLSSRFTHDARSQEHKAYKLGVSYCRTLYKKGGVCIFVQEGLRYVKINMENQCKDKDFEVCAFKIYLNIKFACIIAIYRAPTGNFELSISKLDTILRKLYYCYN